MESVQEGEKCWGLFLLPCMLGEWYHQMDQEWSCQHVVNVVSRKVPHQEAENHNRNNIEQLEQADLHSKEKLCSIIQENQPISIVESEAFQAILNCRVTTRKTISSVISSLCTRVDQILGDTLKSAQHLSTTSYSFTLLKQKFCCHYCSFLLRLESSHAVVGFTHVDESETAVFLSSFLEDSTNRWTDGKSTSAMVTDNEANFARCCKSTWGTR